MISPRNDLYAHLVLSAKKFPRAKNSSIPKSSPVPGRTQHVSSVSPKSSRANAVQSVTTTISEESIPKDHELIVLPHHELTEQHVIQQTVPRPAPQMTQTAYIKKTPSPNISEIVDTTIDNKELAFLKDELYTLELRFHELRQHHSDEKTINRLHKKISELKAIIHKKSVV